MSTVGSGRDSRMNYPITFGKYLLLERINVGGMAEVFKAKAFGVEGFERVLAIKRILPSMADDDEFINMFVDEARIAVQLSHANIVQIYELGKYENQYYIAMEYVSGKDLRQILDRFRKRKQTLPIPAAAFLTSKICEGLDYAHRKSDPTGKPLNLIHRDVSPQNILVSYEGAVKITDFGIAKAEDRASKTQAGVLKGKFGYMSPEQVRGLEIDHRSDIFAVGILMYEMLTGKRLFIGESDFSTLEKVRNADVPPPTQHNPAIPPELERVMLKALAREREERYQWTSELHDDLQQFLIEDNTIYNAKRLSGLLRQEFTSDIEGELAKMEEFMRMAPPTSEKALSAARAMKNAPVSRDRAASARQVVGEKTMIFESGFSEMANAPTQISDESHDPASVSAARFSGHKEDHATGSVVVGKGLRLEQERSASRSASSPVQVRQKAGRDTTILIAAGTAFLALLIVLLVMVFKPKAEVGTLIVVTTPVDRDLDVLLDGQSLGNRSPIIRDDVRLGAHTLVVRAPGYKEQTFAVNVESAGTAYHVPVNFGRPISESSGEIEVASEPPGAQVIVDGKELGLTPTSIKDRDTQKAATVTVSKEGYERQTVTATFETGKNKTRVAVTLKPIDPNRANLAARLTVETTPLGATVFVNGRRMGETPLQIQDMNPKEAVEIKVVKDGYRSQTRSVRFDGQLDRTEPFSLEVGSDPIAAKPPQPAVSNPQTTRRNDDRPLPRKAPPPQVAVERQPSPQPPPRKDPDTPVERTPPGKNVPSGCSGDGAKLSVNTIGEVNCQVQVGTKKLGGAPVFRQSVPIGKCEVRITCPSGKQYKQTVSLGKGDEEKVIVKPGMWQ